MKQTGSLKCYDIMGCCIHKFLGCSQIITPDRVRVCGMIWSINVDWCYSRDYFYLFMDFGDLPRFVAFYDFQVVHNAG